MLFGVSYHSHSNLILLIFGITYFLWYESWLHLDMLPTASHFRWFCVLATYTKLNKDLLNTFHEPRSILGTMKKFKNEQVKKSSFPAGLSGSHVIGSFVNTQLSFYVIFVYMSLLEMPFIFYCLHRDLLIV